MQSKDQESFYPRVFWVTQVPGNWSVDRLIGEMEKHVVAKLFGLAILPTFPSDHMTEFSDALLIFRSIKDEQSFLRLFRKDSSIHLGNATLLIVRQRYQYMIPEMIRFESEYWRVKAEVRNMIQYSPVVISISNEATEDADPVDLCFPYSLSVSPKGPEKVDIKAPPQLTSGPSSVLLSRHTRASGLPSSFLLPGWPISHLRKMS